MIPFEWNGYRGILKAHPGGYLTGDAYAIEFRGGPDGPYERIAMVTVNIETYVPREDEIVVKSWSENAGMAEALENAGIAKTIRKIPTGFTEAHVMRLLKPIEEFY